MAPAIRLVLDAHLLRAANPVRVSWFRRGIGVTLRQSSVSGDAGTTQSLDICRQRQRTSILCLATLPTRPYLSGGSCIGRAVRESTPLEYSYFLAICRIVGSRFLRRLSGASNLPMDGKLKLIRPIMGSEYISPSVYG